MLIWFGGVCAKINLQTGISTTRVSSRENVIVSVLQLHKAILLYTATNEDLTKKFAMTLEEYEIAAELAGLMMISSPSLPDVSSP